MHSSLFSHGSRAESLTKDEVIRAELELESMAVAGWRPSVRQREHTELASASSENTVLVVVSRSQEVCASMMLASLSYCLMTSLRLTVSLFSLSSAPPILR